MGTAASLVRALALARVAAAIAAVFAFGACSGEPVVPPPEQIHTVRGRIVQLPEPSKPANSLQIHHEPIEHYKRADGSLGMNAMIMPFTPAKGLDLAGLAAGDIVEFRWEVRSRDKGPSLVTSIRKLPPETPLNLGKAGGG